MIAKLIYQKIPELNAWLADCERALNEVQVRPQDPGLEAQARADHVLAVIIDLLDDYDALRDRQKQQKQFRKHLIVAYLHEAAVFWLQKGDRPPTPQVPGPRLTRFQPLAIRPVVTALRDVAFRKLKKYYPWVADEDLPEIRRALAERGAGAVNTEAEQDARREGIVWLAQDAERRVYKLRFRGGLAYRLLPHEADIPVFALYTTDPEQTEMRRGLSHFVMDRRGRIYCGYDMGRARAQQFFHSSLIGGEAVMAAGMMRVENGQIVEIANASGHYRPEGHHMAAVVQRLRLYAVDLSRVVVTQYDTRKRYTASEVLSWNDWPEG